RRDDVAKDRPGEISLPGQPLKRERECDEAACNRSRAGAAVGFENVAIDRDRSLAELAHVERRSKSATDEALDLLRPAARGRAATLALLAARRVGARVHLVLGR